MEHTAVFKERLEAELQNLTRELETIATYEPQTDSWTAVPDPTELQTADPTDEADGVEEWNERRALMAQLEVRYRNIKRALEKITAGTYGICEISGEHIETERLEANPAARTTMANADREKELPV